MRPKVLVVDDSAFARKVLREVLADDPRIEVVGFARDGLEALEKIDELRPDVLTLDLVMPNLDGLGVLEALALRDESPRVVIVTMSDNESPLAAAALQKGAFDIVHKPTALATDRLYELRDELVSKVLAAGSGNIPRAGAAMARAAGSRVSTRARVLVIGTSTGGPRAITLLFHALPADFPVPIATVVHMPAGFTLGLAQRLDGECALRVSEARADAVIRAGDAVIGRAGVPFRLRDVRGACTAVLEGGQPGAHRPSVDALFVSAAEAYGDGVVAVVLTGMGNDGLAGARAIRDAGGVVLAEDASTCVVHGMPRAVTEAGLAHSEVPLDRMAQAIYAAL